MARHIYVFIVEIMDNHTHTSDSNGMLITSAIKRNVREGESQTKTVIDRQTEKETRKREKREEEENSMVYSGCEERAKEREFLLDF